jgi:hypothetical protein
LSCPQSQIKISMCKAHASGTKILCKTFRDVILASSCFTKRGKHVLNLEAITPESKRSFLRRSTFRKSVPSHLKFCFASREDIRSAFTLVNRFIQSDDLLQAPCWLDLAPSHPHPARTEAVAHCLVLCGKKKLKPQISNITKGISFSSVYSSCSSF